MSNHVEFVRHHVGTEAVFHVLILVTILTYISESIAFIPEVHPLRLEYLINNDTKLPYVHVNTPGAAPTMLRTVINTAIHLGLGQEEPGARQ